MLIRSTASGSENLKRTLSEKLIETVEIMKEIGNFFEGSESPPPLFLLVDENGLQGFHLLGSFLDLFVLLPRQSHRAGGFSFRHGRQERLLLV
jgi:hypothetical protein